MNAVEFELFLLDNGCYDVEVDKDKASFTRMSLSTTVEFNRVGFTFIGKVFASNEFFEALRDKCVEYSKTPVEKRIEPMYFICPKVPFPGGELAEDICWTRISGDTLFASNKSITTDWDLLLVGDRISDQLFTKKQITEWGVDRNSVRLVEYKV